MDYIEKRKRSLISLTYFAVFAVAYVLFIKYAFWIVAPFIIAFVIAMLLQRPIGFLSRKTHITKKLWSVILVLLLVVVIVGLLSLIIYIAGTEFYDFGSFRFTFLNETYYFIKYAVDCISDCTAY